MAQDFHAAFDLGYETHISTLDTDGIVLAAVQGLHTLVKEQETEMEKQQVENKS